MKRRGTVDLEPLAKRWIPVIALLLIVPAAPRAEDVTLDVHHQVLVARDHGGRVSLSKATDVEMPPLQLELFDLPATFDFALRLEFEQHGWPSIGAPETDSLHSVAERGTLVAAFSIDSVFERDEAIERFEEIALARTRALSAPAFMYDWASLDTRFLFVGESLFPEQDVVYSVLLCTQRESPSRAIAWRVQPKDGKYRTKFNQVDTATSKKGCESLLDQVPDDDQQVWTVREPLRIEGRLLRLGYLDRLSLPAAVLPDGASFATKSTDHGPTDATRPDEERTVIRFGPPHTPVAHLDPEGLHSARSIIAKFTAIDTVQVFGSDVRREETPAWALHVGWFLTDETAKWSLEKLVEPVRRRISKLSEPFPPEELERELAGHRLSGAYAVICPEGEGTASYWIERSSGAISNSAEVCETIKQLFDEESDSPADGR